MLAAIATIASMALPPGHEHVAPGCGGQMMRGRDGGMGEDGVVGHFQRVPFGRWRCYRLPHEPRERVATRGDSPPHQLDQRRHAGERRRARRHRTLGAGFAAGWAIGGLFQLGDLVTHALEAALVLLALTGLFYFLRAALSHEPIRG